MEAVVQYFQAEGFSEVSSLIEAPRRSPAALLCCWAAEQEIGLIVCCSAFLHFLFRSHGQAFSDSQELLVTGIDDKEGLVQESL